MLQCQQDALYPHYRIDGIWSETNWINKHTVTFPLRIEKGEWFYVSIMVINSEIVLELTINNQLIPIKTYWPVNTARQQ